MQDLLYVSFDYDERMNEKGIVVGRPCKDGSHKILKMLLDDKAEKLYRVLTEQSTDFNIVKKDGNKDESKT